MRDDLYIDGLDSTMPPTGNDQTAVTSAKPRRASNAATPFRFLDLSAELRNSIYELALISDEPIDLISSNHTALPQVSRQLRTETHDIFYSSNCFLLYQREERARHDHRTEQWLSVIGAKNVARIRKLHWVNGPFSSSSLELQQVPSRLSLNGSSYFKLELVAAGTEESLEYAFQPAELHVRANSEDQVKNPGLLILLSKVLLSKMYEENVTMFLGVGIVKACSRAHPRGS